MGHAAQVRRRNCTLRSSDKAIVCDALWRRETRSSAPRSSDRRCEAAPPAAEEEEDDEEVVAVADSM